MAEQTVIDVTRRVNFFVGMRLEDFSRYEDRVAAYADEGRTQPRTLGQVSTPVTADVVRIHRGVGDLEEGMGTTIVEYGRAKRSRLAQELGIPIEEMQIYRETTTVVVEEVE